MTDSTPVACHYGRENGDGTYSPTYERWPLPPYVTPYKGMPIKLFYAAPQPALTEAVHAYFKVIDDNNAGVIDRLEALAALRKAAGIAVPDRGKY